MAAQKKPAVKSHRSPEPRLPQIAARAVEFVKAGRRIMNQRGVYGNESKALNWVIGFAQEDLTALSEGGRMDRWEEVKRFAFDAGMEKGLLADSRLPLGNRGGVTWDMPDGMTVSECLADLQRRLLNALRAFVEDKALRMEVAVSLRIYASAEHAGVIVIGGAPTMGFLYHLAQLLADVGLGVHRCRGCQKLFYATRSDKVYCDARCLAKAFKRAKASKQSGTTTQRRTTHGTTR